MQRAENRALARTGLAGDAGAPIFAILRRTHQTVKLRQQSLAADEIARTILGKIEHGVALSLLPRQVGVHCACGFAGELGRRCLRT